MFKILNYIFAKINGVSTISEYCRGSVSAVLQRNNIVVGTIACNAVDRSENDPRLMERVYIGTGQLNGEAVAFVVMIDESAGIPFGYLVSESNIHRVDELKRQYLKLRRDGISFNRFFMFILGELGEEEELHSD
ncbi:MAG: hypothetical protein ACT4OK_11600 [Gemmobacter sp.]